MTETAARPAALQDEALADVAFDKIQLPVAVLADMAEEIARRGPAPRVLVFGLGYDTPVHQHITARAGGRIVFVEQNDDYIAMNPTASVLRWPASKWGTRVGDGMVDDEQLPPAPRKQLARLLGIRQRELAFDVVLVDGPTGYNDGQPGRQGACMWASRLVKPGGVVYVDDANRSLERASITRYLNRPAFRKQASWAQAGKRTVKVQRL
jgi:SAM-dependent methyltransferase